LTYTDAKVQATAAFELKGTPSGTQATFVEDVEDLQGKAKRAERMLKMMEKQDDDLLDRLKAHVEATTEEPAGLMPEPKVVEAPAAPRPAKVAKAAAKPKPAKKAKSAKPAAKKGKKAAKKR
jgi:peptidoglycan hydrolase CwlO-like protein